MTRYLRYLKAISHTVGFQEGSGSKLSFAKALQSNLVNTDTEGVVESARINGVSVKSRSNLETM